MEKETIQKVATLAYILLATATWYAVGTIFKSLAAASGSVQRLYSVELAQHGIPLVFGVATFFILFTSAVANKFSEEVCVEVGKVSWPTRKGSIGMGIVVIVVVLFSSLTLWGVDIVANFSVDLVVKLLDSVSNFFTRI